MKGMGPRELPVRAVELLIGLTIAHLGVTLFLLSDLGSDPFNVLIQGLHRALPWPAFMDTHGRVHLLVSLIIMLVLLVAAKGFVKIGTVICMALGGPIIYLWELLLDPVTRNGRFLNDYVESEKQNLIDAIRGIINDKRDYADLRLLQEMCRGERYGVDKFGSIARVEKITNQTLFRYYQELLSTAHLELFYCGSAERERVEEAISRAFAPLQRGRVVPPVIAEKKNAPETPREITERMDVTQGKLSMGWRASTNDAPAMMLANLIFGGYSNSKLFLNVREKLSLCYYASSAYHRSKGIVTVSSGIECRDVETAKREILAQLASVQRGEFEEWEVEGARACLIASLESRGDSAGRMEENALGQAATGIRETADELIAALRAVTNERIAEAAQSMTLDTVYFLTGEDSKDE